MTTQQEGVLPATAGGAPVPEPFRRMFWIAAEDIANKIGCTVIEGTPRSYGEPDPRDGEIERLRGEVFSNNVALGRAVNRIARALDVTPPADVRDLVAGIKRLARERDEAREEWKRADAEVTRLKREADQQPKYYGGLVNRIHEALGDDRRVEVANRGGLANAVLRLAYAFSGVTSERDRLREELDLTGEKHAAGLTTLRRGFNAYVDRLMPKAKAEDKPAELRRWSKGDPEPEIGTTVRYVNGARHPTFTRRTDGRWHCDAGKHDPNTCDASTLFTWEQITSNSARMPFVEVVSSDG